jgi:hypothetical protein
MRYLVIAAALAFASPSLAAECRPLVDFVEEGSQHGLEIKPLPSSILPVVTEVYNSQPPASEEHFTGAAYAEFPSGNAIILLLKGDGVCGHLKAPAAIWVKLKALAFGEGV